MANGCVSLPGDADADRHETIGIAEGQRPQQDGPHEREDRRVGPDREGERRHHRQREEGRRRSPRAAMRSSAARSEADAARLMECTLGPRVYIINDEVIGIKHQEY
jgi:hypothetical protein